ncbi:MAG: DNA replication/repair protein RecF [Lentisphaerales bacterium]|nr:DNA replication/repair protein RecF [Lentisphaerales bacterium]
MGYLSKLTLENFRNYQNAELSLKAGLTIFYGENGQGKTSLLEAIYFLSLLRSFRTRNIQNLKRWQQDAFAISCRLEHEDLLADQLQITYGEKRKLQMNGNAVSRSSEFIRQINAISFTPEDIELIKGSAGGRRQFLDITLSQLSPTYLTNLQHYNKALKSRNIVLKKSTDDPNIDNLIRTYDDMLIQYGSLICLERLQLLEKLAPKISAFTAEMFPEKKKLKLIYQSSLGKITDNLEMIQDYFRLKCEDNRQKDIQRGMTHIGPHRDDIFILLSGKSLGAFGSEGQCRLASLVIKMAAAEQLIEDKETDNVLLLIDDVLGELDAERKQAFLKTIMRGDQVFIACTDIPEYCKTLDYEVFEIDEGKALSAT